jgi:hypothetical protein
MLYNLPDDDKKWLKLVVDDNEMCSILQVVFILDNKHRQCFHVHTNKRVKQSCYKPGVAQRVPGS